MTATTTAPRSLVIDGISVLVTNAPDLGAGPLGEITDAAIVVADGRVAWAGPAGAAPAADVRVDAAGRCVIPGFVDSHTHIVFAGDRGGYVDLVTGPMLDACAPHARWIDVFCERGAFDEEVSRRVLLAGRERGLAARVHGNQLGTGPGVRLAVEVGAASVDHCTHLTAADVAALSDAASDGSGTVATLLPGVDFATRQPYPDARALLDAAVPVALASDCNPGSCFTSSVAFCIALAVREMRMTPREALYAATAGGARALRRTDVGHLGVGARADLVLLDAPDPVYLAYRPGVPLVAAVWQDGELVSGDPAR
ncbi:amidohydrolase family protein [Marinitenerispora sediminis]|uniref:imidazolonepropionase n=1 Tax=Marinitenerispora sediminis TaxID=1931232 RepID=A0A368T266_9ACTN|nr:amidohydrolase family protein [Marinitenerispora sediminis]RCV54723.1 hypothetical protein DEF24_18900 [Marinitenerispora sediminis]